MPAAAEVGFPGFRILGCGLNGLVNLPKAAIAISLNTPQAAGRLRGDTTQPIGDPPAQLAAFITAEQVRRRVIEVRAKVKRDKRSRAATDR